MPDEIPAPAIPDSTVPESKPDSSSVAMMELIKNLQAGMQQIQAKMANDSKELVEKCKMVSPLGGDFRDYNEIGYILQYIRTDKTLRRQVIEIVKQYADKQQQAATATATAAAVLAPK